MDENKAIIDKLSLLTLEADLLIEVLHNAMKNQNLENDEDTGSACYLLEIIRKKFEEIRELF